MHPATVLAGLGCGMVLAAGAAIARARTAESSELARSARLLTWVAALVLLLGALIAWYPRTASPALASRLFAVAAIAAPVSLRREMSDRDESRILTAAALVLAASGLYASWVHIPTFRVGCTVGLGATSRVETLVAVLAAGLGIRSASAAIARAADPPPGHGTATMGVSLLLGWLMVMLTLPSLWTRGTLGPDTRGFAGIASAFLAWSAIWVLPRDRRIGYASVVTAAAVWLLWITLSLL